MNDRRDVARATVVLVAVFLMALGGCRPPKERGRLLYIDSYCPGDATSDALLAGMYDVVAASKARLDIFFMDTKHCPLPEAIADRTEEALAAVRDTRPEVVIVSGDSAVQWLLAEHLRDGPSPSVFCATGWSPEPQGLSTEYVTGIRQTAPVWEAVTALKPYYPGLQRVVVLSGGPGEPPAGRAGLDAIFSDLGVVVTYVAARTYDEWKTEFVRASDGADAIFLPTNQGVESWDEAEARAFVREHSRVPAFTCDASMMKYAVFGIVASYGEQGQWAARTALRILRGKRPVEIPIAQAPPATAWINESLADRIGFAPEDELLARCRRSE